MNERQTIVAKQKHLRKMNRQYPPHLIDVPGDQWPENVSARPFRVLRSRDFLVTCFNESDGIVRLTVCRTEIDGAGMWRSDIDWDTMQRLKAESGYEFLWAAEILPPANQLVNVANMRHIWVLPSKPEYGWSKQP